PAGVNEYVTVEVVKLAIPVLMNGLRRWSRPLHKMQPQHFTYLRRTVGLTEATSALLSQRGRLSRMKAQSSQLERLRPRPDQMRNKRLEIIDRKSLLRALASDANRERLLCHFPVSNDKREWNLLYLSIANLGVHGPLTFVHNYSKVSGQKLARDLPSPFQVAVRDRDQNSLNRSKPHWKRTGI